MTYTVTKKYVVEAETKEKAKYIIEQLELKNQQGLFQTSVSVEVSYEPDKSIWPKLW